MQAVIAENIFNKNGGSIPVCTERKATGKYVLECFLSATMHAPTMLKSDHCLRMRDTQRIDLSAKAHHD